LLDFGRRESRPAGGISSVVHSARSCPLTAGIDATDLVNRLQGTADLEIRLAKLANPEEHPLHLSGAGSSVRSGTDLRYVAPPVLDQRGGSWLAELRFDLSNMKRDSVRLIIDLVVAIVIGATVFSLVIFVLFRRALLVPLHELAQSIDRMASGDADAAMPRFESREMTELAASIERLAGSRKAPKV
jgi:methyl-accepting chemotaxis protein